MSLYDSGAGRKPPLPSNQLAQQQPSYTNYNNNDEYLQQQPSNEIVIVETIPNNNNGIGEIGCIILSTDLREKESFSFNFTVHNSFETQADYIFSSLDNRIWIITDQYDLQQTIDQSFKAMNKNSPQPQRIINATQIFNVKPNVSGATNARIGCSTIYSTLQRIALNNLLSPIISVTNVLPTQTQTIQSVIEPSNDFSSPTQQQDVALNTNSNDQWTNTQNNDNNDMIINDTTNYNNNQVIIDNNNIQNVSVDTNNINENTSNYNNTPFNNNNDVEAVNNPDDNDNDDSNANNTTQNDIEEAPIDDNQQYDNNQINGFHEEVPATNNKEPQIEDVAEQQEPEQYEQQQQQQQEQEEEEVATKENRSDSNTATPSKSVTPSNESGGAALTAASSWAAKFKVKTSSPKRRALGVVDHVSDNIYGKNQRGKYASTKSADGIRNSIADSIDKKRIIWVSYNGHQKPFIPRAIRPQSWDNRGKQKESSFFAIQHKSKSQNQQRFYLKNVLEVRDKQWRISNTELAQLKIKYPQYNNYNNNNYSERNNQNQNDNNYNNRRYNNQNGSNYGRGGAGNGGNKNFQNKRPRQYQSNNGNNQ